MATTFRLLWRGKETLAKARAAAVAGLTRGALRIEGAAKAELYPGHGKLTGTLQRAISAEPAREVSPTRVRARVAVKGVPYARAIERRYAYLAEGYRKSKDQVANDVQAALKEAFGG